MPIVPITNFKGLHNKGPSLRLPSGALAVADNVNVLDTGALQVRAASAEAAFTRYFGLLPDSDLRRRTREDVPHFNTAFLP